MCVSKNENLIKRECFKKYDIRCDFEHLDPINQRFSKIFNDSQTLKASHPRTSEPRRAPIEPKTIFFWISSIKNYYERKIKLLVKFWWASMILARFFGILASTFWKSKIFLRIFYSTFPSATFCLLTNIQLEIKLNLVKNHWKMTNLNSNFLQNI